MSITTLAGQQYTKIDHKDGRIELIPVVVPVEDKDWVPELGEKYWFIDGMGRLINLYQGAGKRLEHHNVYRTEPEAEKAAKYMRRCNAVIRACMLIEPDFNTELLTDTSAVKWSPTKNIHKRDGENFWGPLWVKSTVPSAPACVSTRELAIEACELLTKWGVE